MLDPTEPIIAPPPAVPSGLLVDGARAAVLRQASRDWPSWDLTPRQLADLELLLSGFYEPLVGFMGRDDYEAVLTTMRLASGQLWPLPIGLAITPALAASMKPGATLALRDPEGVMLAALHVADVWELTPARRTRV